MQVSAAEYVLHRDQQEPGHGENIAVIIILKLVEILLKTGVTKYGGNYGCDMAEL